MAEDDEKKIYAEMPSSSKRATIGIRYTDIETGTAFYREAQELMAQLYPREYDRPKVFLDLGGTNDNSSALLGSYWEKEKFNVILVPGKKVFLSDEEKRPPAFTADTLIKAIDPKSHPRINQVGSDLFTSYSVKIVDKDKFQSHAEIQHGNLKVKF